MDENHSETSVREAFRLQSQYCRSLGSAFTCALCEVIGERLTYDSEVGARILRWRGRADAHGDSVPLRVAGGLHALAMRGDIPSLSALYPPNPIPDREVFWNVLEAVLRDEEKHLLKWLASPPQTNEVARSAILMAGLLVIASNTKLPLALYELGASGGLNLMLDRYGYRLGDVEFGNASSNVRLAPVWSGASPPLGDVQIVRRCGVDLAPLDVTKPEDQERLLATIWPDQAERRDRTAAAIAIASQDPPRIDACDAANWIEKTLSMDPEPNCTRVVMHSIAFQYFPPDAQARIAAHMIRVGRVTTANAPLAWLRFEMDPERQPELSLTLWPGGEERRLAIADAHVRSINWT